MAASPEPLRTQEMIQRLLSPERAETLDPLLVLSYCPITSYDTVADIGCGPGYFTLPLAKALINGKVYALDTDDEMLAACRQRVALARLGNVEVLQCSQFDFPVESGSLDGAFLAFVVQASLDKARFLREVRQLLRPRGWGTVLEWYRKETRRGPPLERRMDPPELEDLARGAGFRAPSWRDLNGDQYLMTLRPS